MPTMLPAGEIRRRRRADEQHDPVLAAVDDALERDRLRPGDVSRQPVEQQSRAPTASSSSRRLSVSIARVRSTD